MNDKKDKNKELVVYGELIEDEPKPVEKTIDRPLSYLSYFPLYNKLQRARIKSARKVIQEETGLAEDLTNHGRAIGRLKDVDIEIETDRLERLNRLRQAQRESKLSEKRDELAEIEIDEQIAARKASIRKLAGESNDSEVNKLKEELKVKLLKRELYDEHEIKKFKARFKKTVKKELAIEDALEEVAHEIFKGKPVEEFDENEQEIYQRLEDIYESFQDQS
jgi:hypothetical protein